MWGNPHRAERPPGSGLCVFTRLISLIMVPKSHEQIVWEKLEEIEDKVNTVHLITNFTMVVVLGAVGAFVVGNILTWINNSFF